MGILDNIAYIVGAQSRGLSDLSKRRLALKTINLAGDVDSTGGSCRTLFTKLLLASWPLGYSILLRQDQSTTLGHEVLAPRKKSFRD